MVEGALAKIHFRLSSALPRLTSFIRIMSRYLHSSRWASSVTAASMRDVEIVLPLDMTRKRLYNGP